MGSEGPGPPRQAIAQHHSREASRRSRPPAGRKVTIVLQETRTEHEPTVSTAAQPTRGAPPTPRLAALLRSADAHGATVSEHRQRSPINLCRNYYDGGRDFEVARTLELAFTSVSALRGFLGDAYPELVNWLQDRRRHAAHLCVGTAQITVAGDHDLDLLVALLESFGAVEPDA